MLIPQSMFYLCGGLLAMFALLGCASGQVRPEEPRQILRKIVAPSNTNDVTTIETTYRGKTKILATIARNGKLSRHFLFDNHTVMIESDEDGDGFAETLIIVDRDGKRFEMFTRSRDGSVTPVNAERLREARKKVGGWRF